MPIVKMNRFRLIALEQDRATLLSRLQRLGCVEVSEAEENLSSPDWADLLQRDSSSSGEVKTQISQVTYALDALRKYANVKSSLFQKRPSLTEQEFLDSESFSNALQIAASIGESLTSISRLHTQENRLIGMKQGLLPWSSLNLPLNQLSTKHVQVTLGVCPSVISIADLTQALAEAAPLSMLTPLSQDKDQHYLMLLCHEEEKEAAEAVLKSYAFSTTQFKEFSGTPSEEIAKIQAELDDIAQRRKSEEEKIVSYADSQKALQHCFDRLQQDLERENAREHLLTNGTVIFLEGWASQTGLTRLEDTLKQFSCAYSFEDPTAEDTPPTLLKNPKWMTPINMVTEMYSLPAYHGGIDPNPLIFGFYILFFGFMFADIGYGIILAIACGLITKKLRPKNTMGYMFRLGVYLGISSAFFGVLTGGLFGDALNVFTEQVLGMESGISLPALIDPLQYPMPVLYIALGMGMVQLVFGQCVHIYMGFRDKKPLDGILDVVPWWIVFAGIGIFALQGSALGIWIGLASLVLTQGRHKKGIFGKLFGGVASLYDITSWLSDVLSYSRLMALMLASSVIASVMNTLGALPRNIIVFAVVFVIGHVFNIGVNLIGTYVHAARLQYLEFFGKFYVEGGIPFHPLKYRTKYIDIKEEET